MGKSERQRVHCHVDEVRQKKRREMKRGRQKESLIHSHDPMICKLQVRVMMGDGGHALQLKKSLPMRILIIIIKDEIFNNTHRNMKYPCH